MWGKSLLFLGSSTKDRLITRVTSPPVEVDTDTLRLGFTAVRSKASTTSREAGAEAGAKHTI